MRRVFLLLGVSFAILALILGIVFHSKVHVSMSVCSMIEEDVEKDYLLPDSDCVPLPDSYLVKKRLSVHLEKRRGSLTGGLTDFVKEHTSLTLSYLLRSVSYASSASSSDDAVEDIYAFRVRDLNGNEVSLEKYRNFVLIIVNVASECGLTQMNYEQLNYLHDKYYDKGLRILAFPCNQFGQQEPGSCQQISSFIENNDVKFDVFEKVEVNGENAHPLFLYLQTRLPGSLTNHIKWNFTKFLISKKGVPVDRFAPTTSPKSMEEDILHYLGK